MKKCSFADYLSEKKMSRSDLERTLRASDSDKDINALKDEVSQFYSNLSTDAAGLKKVFAKAKAKPAIPEVQLFMVAYKKLQDALNSKESGEE